MNTNKERINNLQKKLADRFGIEVKYNLLVQSMSHTSYVNEINEDRSLSYEKLEFLGDAVLQFVITEYIYRNYPDLDEGELTRFRANIVQSASLSQFSLELGLDHAVLLGQGELKNSGNRRRALMEDIFESLLGAIYLSSGLQAVTKFLNESVIKDIKSGNLKMNVDYKTTLQELLQEAGSVKIEYIPREHLDQKDDWTTDLYVNDQLLGSGVGHNRKSAEQQAAQVALEKLQAKQDH
ncbi:ribonuclease III [Xylocopilactobacillus apicola]|uniref:Ribonuclease 3 n=1 Tax=Xylocopilactobacillus apicola TaxID=2932184 RepID=A0AAU9DW42_9LACO|nr:ribonuclease III [Xylocopilactobacillus apicola]BDR58173.1 ribonuclease 3 [Xylocopilactobacillus apicola]